MRLPQFIRPLPGVWLMFGLLIANIVIFGSQSHSTVTIAAPGSGDAPRVEAIDNYAFGALHRVKHPEPSHWVIHWGGLAINLLLCYVTALLIAHAARRTTRRDRPFSGIWFVALASALIAIGLGGLVSKSMWGYWFWRPAPLTRTYPFKSVTSWVPFSLGDGQGLSRWGSDAPSIAAFAKSRVEHGDYYCLAERMPLDLHARGLIKDEPTFTHELLEDLKQRLENTGLLAESSPGYDSSLGLSGILIDGTDPEGRRLICIGARGGQVSNDTYPYYEFAFRAQSAGTSDVLYQDGQLFFYDVAGMEGLEWHVVAAPAGLLLLVLGVAGMWLVRSHKAA